MNRCVKDAVALVVFIVALSLPALPQSNSVLQTFFQQNLGLSQDQIAAIQNGQPVAKAMPSRKPDEVFLIGAVYIHAAPENYVKLA